MVTIKVRQKFSSLTLVLLSLLVLGGCATPTNELRVGKLMPKQRIYVGRVLVNFGDMPQSDLNCELYINRDLVPAFKLSRDGYFFYKTDRGEPKLSKIACYHRPTVYLAAWHHQNIPVKAFYRPAEQKEAVYFGELKINWNFDKSKTEPAAERQPITSTPPREAHVYNSGEIKVEVKSDFEMMNRLFFEKVEGARENGFELKEHLLQKDQ